MNYQRNLRSSNQLLKIIALSAGVLTSVSAHAYTLNDALISAHENNYSVLAEFSNLEAAKKAEKQSYTGFLPTVSANAKSVKVDSAIPGVKDSKYSSRSLTVTQPIFKGGDTLANIKIANSSLLASKANFMAVSNDISMQAVKAYEGLLTARDILQLAQNNEKVISEILKLTKTRFKHGEVTKTDVLQAESNHSFALAQTSSAEAELKAAEATFIRVTGRELPDSMDAIDYDSVKAPETYEEFLDRALKNNPSLAASKNKADIGKYEIQKSYSTLLPKVSAQANFTRTSLPKTSANTADNNSYVLNVEVPIFQSGSEYLEISKKKHLAQNKEFEFKEIERKIIERAVASWNNYKAKKYLIKTYDDAVKAQKKVLEGIKEESKAGTRTTIDVLDAQKELFRAQVQKRKATLEFVESAYSILQLMGEIDPIDILNS